MLTKKLMTGMLALALATPGMMQTGGVYEDEEVQQLDPFVTTGTRSEHLIREVPVRTEVIGQELIETLGAKDLACALEWNTGIRVEANCQNCNFSQVRMLGMQGEYTGFLTNGRPVMSSLARVYGIEQIPASAVEQIEVVKGGGSALYGPRIVAGVVNIVPKKPTEIGGNLSYELESYGDGPMHNASGSGYWVGTEAVWSGSVTGLYQTRPGYDRDGDGFTEVTERTISGITGRVFFNPNAKSEWYLDLGYTAEERRGGDNLDRPVTDAEVAEWIDSELFSAALNWKRQIGDKTLLETTASYLNTERDTYYGGGGDPNAFGFSKNPAYFLDALLTHQFTDSISASGGLQYSNEELTDEQPAYDRLLEENYENMGYLAQVEWNPNSRWSGVAGFRVDDVSSIDGLIFSPRASIRFSPSATVDYRFSVSTGFRPPEVFDEDLHIGSSGGESNVIRNSADLKEESSLSLMAGAYWQPEWTIMGVSEPFFLEGNLFWTQLQDAFDVVEIDNPGTPETEFFRINAGEAYVYGVELNAGYGFRPDLVLEGGIVLQQARYDEPAGDFGSKNFERTPDAYGQLRLTYTPDWGGIFFGGRYTGSMEVPHYAGWIPEDRLETSESFLELTLGMTYNLRLSENTLWVLKAGVRNLTDAYQDDLDSGPDRDSAYVYGPRFPRSLYLGAEWVF